MFLTNEAHRSPLLGLFAGDDDTYWRVVEKVVLRPWYLVTLKQREAEENEPGDTEGGFEFTRTILISEFRDLLSLLNLASNALYLPTLESVLVITPAHMNGSGVWQMDRLAAIWRPKDAFEGNSAGPCEEILETVAGKLFHAHPMEDAGDSHDDLTLVFRLPTENP